jgi:hypothetical protein
MYFSRVSRAPLQISFILQRNNKYFEMFQISDICERPRDN